MTINPLRMFRYGFESLNQRLQVLSSSLLNRVKNKPVVAREVARKLSEQTAINKPSQEDLFAALAISQAQEDPPSPIPINDASFK
jgi:hypothetical protein